MRFHGSQIELSEAALRRNIRFLRELVGEQRCFVSVIKGNAYGHGIRSFVPLAERCGVRHFAVFSADEALLAWDSRTTDSKIVIMGDIDPNALPWAVQNGVSFYVFDQARLTAAIATAQQVGLPARIHLELETGLNRTGLDDEALVLALDAIQRNPEQVQVEGICTHFAGAESVSNYLRIQTQFRRFNDLCEVIRKRGVQAPRHTACSAAAITYPETRMEMVRVGIAQYGFWPTQETRMHYLINNGGAEAKKMPDPLRRVMRWTSRVMSVKRVRAGDFVGYGTSYMTNRTENVATVPVGYFHGFARSLSNLGHVLVRGRRAAVVGTVNMNMMTIDATDVPGVEPGDEVVLIGKQRKAQISVSSFSDMSRFLNYEVLVRLPSEIPRVVVK